MKKMKRVLRNQFAIALVTSIMMVVGIPLIPISAVNGITWLLVVAIVFTAYGFYGCPLYWISYASKRELYSILFLIENEHILTVEGLCQQTGKDGNYIADKIRYLLLGGFLPGYIFSGNALEKTVIVEKKPVVLSIPCPSCGAPITLTDGEGKCEYCGSSIHK